MIAGNIPTAAMAARTEEWAGGQPFRVPPVLRLVDFGDVRANDWLAVNQFTVIEGASSQSSADASQHNRRPDIVVFINGLPLGLIELKNAVNEETDIWSAYAQLQTYKAEIASLLHYNAALVVSDGLQARMGSVTANQEWFKVWRTIDGEGDAPKTALELEVLVRGVVEQLRAWGAQGETELDGRPENVTFTMPKELRVKAL